MPAEASDGMSGVVAGTPVAADAGAETLAAGGNAIDAGIAACLALCVSDPPNLSIAGRCHAVVGAPGGMIELIDGATEVPTRPSEFGPIPIPGLPDALALLHERHGRLPQRQLFEPAVRAAEQGFVVSPEVRHIWSRRADELAADPGCRRHYLVDGRAPQPGETVRLPTLAAFLRDLQADGLRSFYCQPSVTRRGPWARQDLDAYRARIGEVGSLALGDNKLLTTGRQAWGPVLIELVGRLIEIDGDDDARLLEAIARACASVLHHRLAPSAVAMPDQDTTHLASVDADGRMLSLTASIGPHFGSRKAGPEAGFLFAHSYQMASRQIVGRRDVTEMCPTLLMTDGRPWLAIGAAGSERIPQAVAQVLRHRLRCQLPLPQALTAPRVAAAHGRARLWRGARPSQLQTFATLGWRAERAGPGHVDHVGIVHALERMADGRIVGGADDAYDGTIRIVSSPAR